MCKPTTQNNPQSWLCAYQNCTYYLFCNDSKQTRQAQHIYTINVVIITSTAAYKLSDNNNKLIQNQKRSPYTMKYPYLFHHSLPYNTREGILFLLRVLPVLVSSQLSLLVLSSTLFNTYCALTMNFHWPISILIDFS